jgi:hypothetical protein
MRWCFKEYGRREEDGGVSSSGKPSLERLFALKKTEDNTYIYLTTKNFCGGRYKGFSDFRLLNIKETIRAVGFRGRQGAVIQYVFL